MNFEKIISKISIIITVFICIIMFISGTFWISALDEVEKRKWLFITITCIVILLVNMGLMGILSYMKKKEKQKSPNYVSKRKANTAAGILIMGVLIMMVFSIGLIYILALIPKNSLDTYIYSIGVMIWIGFILMLISLIYAVVTDAYKTKEQKT